jgi:two-component system OmpR family sensor kinase
LTLRRKLIAVQVGLVAVGLAAFAVVSYRLYSHSAYQQINSQLESASPLLSQGLGGGPGLPQGGNNDSDGDNGVSGPPANAGHNLPPGGFSELRTAAGLTVDEYQVRCYGSDACPIPRLPATIAAPARDGQRLFTVASSDGSTSFRVLVRPATSFAGLNGPGLDGAVVITAIPLTDTIRSLHHLILLDISVGAGVLILLSGAGLLIIRRGLHPLERMALTARAIARGDLSQRASPAGGKGEVGQLGLAFNSMMGEIQRAFAARDATEGRLRQFLADASHELRTPLTSIRGYAELYRMGAARHGEELDTVMARIEENAQQMGGLVEELLLLARLDQTRPPERAEVDLVVLVADACEDAAVTAPGRKLRLDAPSPVRVVGDASHLRQAITNLLMNAIRHTPDDAGIDVSVAVDGGAALIRVRDHGPGLPPEGLAHAFDRFWRADRSRTGTGSGLGLAIVAAVANEHGGHASVRNAPDGGAVFDIRLPIPRDGSEIPAGSSAPPRKP